VVPCRITCVFRARIPGAATDRSPRQGALGDINPIESAAPSAQELADEDASPALSGAAVSDVALSDEVPLGTPPAGPALLGARPAGAALADARPTGAALADAPPAGPGAAGLPPAPAPRSERPRRRLAPAAALVRACRPRQWVKNVLVLAAPGAAGILVRPEVAGEVALTFVAFCMISSATYLLNDVHDRGEDREHPRRVLRPVASGELSVRAAVGAALALTLAGLGIAAAVRPAVALVGVAYVALTGTYTLWWRSVAVADMAAVAGGFVLRALAGGVATAVPVSRWFMLVTSFGALFLVAGKRYAELREGERGALVRASLREYSAEYLRFVLGLAATVTMTAYCLWAFQRSHHARLSWYELTVVPVVLWLLRYALLLDRGRGQAPEELVLGDGFLLGMSATWVAVFVCGVYVVG
jgi:decaprenyl-phosphate phosphoribosyltransferase